tara:strand:- start:674 stop:892 length:219 start_codon:yes stop_codon:yes gene_type:complete
MKRKSYVKNNSETEVMKKLKEQRGKYDDTFELWNAKQLELEQKREEYRQLKTKERVLDLNRKRSPNKTDYYD